MINLTREEAQQVLNALEEFPYSEGIKTILRNKLIAPDVMINGLTEQETAETMSVKGLSEPEETQAANLHAMKTELWKPEPDCYGDGNVYRGVRSKDSEAKTIYTESKKEWVGLTQDEVADFALFHAVVDEECVRAIETKLKEKNNG